MSRHSRSGGCSHEVKLGVTVCETSLKAMSGAQIIKATVNSSVVGANQEACLCVDIGNAAWGLVLKFGSSSRRRSRGVDLFKEKGLAHM